MEVVTRQTDTLLYDNCELLSLRTLRRNSRDSSRPFRFPHSPSYFGSISTIHNTAGTASFTLSALKQAITEIMAARSPNQVRTLDYLSEYDSGDHADHLTTARIVSSLVGNAAPGAGFSGYIGYGVANYPPTMSTSDPAFSAKSNAFFAYTPYDSAECQSYSACVGAGRAESYWLTR